MFFNRHPPGKSTGTCFTSLDCTKIKEIPHVFKFSALLLPCQPLTPRQGVGAWDVCLVFLTSSRTLSVYAHCLPGALAQVDAQVPVVPEPHAHDFCSLYSLLFSSCCLSPPLKDPAPSGSLNKRKPTLTSSSSCYRHSKIPPGKRNIKSQVPTWNGNKSKTHISITENSSFAPKRAFHVIAKIVGHKEQYPEMLLQEKNVRVCPEIATRKFCNVLRISVSTKEARGRENRQRLRILLLPANNPILSFFKREFMYNLLLFLLFLLPLSCTDLPEELQGLPLSV